MSNIVYVLTNPAMPNIVKIGKTTRDNPQVRMDELYRHSGVPLPFECVVAIELEDVQADGLEKALHIAFAPNRVNPRREFFEIEAGQAEAILRQFSGQDVTPNVNEESDDNLDTIDRETVKQFKAKRPPLNFVEMGIPIGSTLKSLRTDEEITVVEAKKVLCREEKMSLTKATKTILELDYSPAPCPQWLFDGRNLNEIFRETYGVKA